MKTIIRNALILAAALPLAACDGDSSGPSRFEGRTDFQYSGAYSGSFHAESSGGFAEFETGSLAFGQRYRDDADDELAVFAQQDREGTLVDNLLLGLRDPAVGTFTCQEDDTDCPFAAFLALGDDGADEEDDADAILFSTAGTVTITSLTDKRVRGTFRLTVSDLFESQATRTEITSGSFDVALIDPFDGGFSRAALHRASLNRSR